MSILNDRRVLVEASDKEPSPSPSIRERPVRSQSDQSESHVGASRAVGEIAPKTRVGDLGGLKNFHVIRSKGEKKKLALDAKKVDQCSPENIDECAEAFIRRFRQQLQIQRLESIENYEQMLTRGL